MTASKRIVTVSGLCAAFPGIFPTSNSVHNRVFKRQLPSFKMPNSNRVLFDLDVVEAFLLSHRTMTADELRDAAMAK